MLKFLVGPGFRYLTLSTLLLFTPELAGAAENSAQQDENKLTADSPLITLEEIIVTATRPARAIRFELENARTAFFNSYNELNTRDEYDVDCRRTDWTHTHIQSTYCFPAFFDEATAEEVSMAFIHQDFGVMNVKQLARLYRLEFERLTTNIIEVAGANPELASSLAEVGKLEAALQRKQEDCMDQPGILFFRLCS